ncbi:hypothetical protein ElyMa_003501200 [Elysia marginata]|uniref:Uncharacterized protein n=1 Tax=Elysia marginata TaxID=1093978 RepID=A0AAV4EG40_9GAST|nr:hypothetical protein ElyMa_003501200 [Elysia marginata]
MEPHGAYYSKSLARGLNMSNGRFEKLFLSAVNKREGSIYILSATIKKDGHWSLDLARPGLAPESSQPWRTLQKFTDSSVCATGDSSVHFNQSITIVFQFSGEDIGQRMGI